VGSICNTGLKTTLASSSVGPRSKGRRERGDHGIAGIHARERINTERRKRGKTSMPTSLPFKLQSSRTVQLPFIISPGCSYMTT
jgi:hypothetical protein